MSATMKRVLVLLKRSAYDLYIGIHRDISFLQNQVAGNLFDRHQVHEQTVQKCKDVLDRKAVDWKLVMREELDRPIRGVDLVITVGGDGTLLQASHYLDDDIPVLGVNSDPTKSDEVESKLEEFDATRSRGYLCGASADNFEQVLDEILEKRRMAIELHRIQTYIDDVAYDIPALNDVLLAHPNPASVSRFTFRICKQSNGDQIPPLIHSRSSGLRLCTAAGSTAAMHSAGGYSMPLLSENLQYMVREPILPYETHVQHLRGWVKKDEVMHIRWGCRQGCIYFDGSHLSRPITFGSTVKISSGGPPLKIFL